MIDPSEKIVEVIKEKIPIYKLQEMAQKMFGDMVKAVVDVEQKIMSIGGELHSDEEALLIESGSRQENLWGINLYPEIKGEDWIEFNSMINLRPSQGNRSRGVDDYKIRKEIIEIVNSLVER